MNALLIPIAKVLAQVTEPLGRALISPDHLRPLLERYGWAADEVDDASMQTIRARLNLTHLLGDIERLAGQLADESGGDSGDALDTALELLDQFTALTGAIRALASVQRDDLPFPLDQEQFWQELPVQLVDDLLLSYLEEEQGVLFGAMLLLGLAEVELVEPDTGRNRTRYLRRRLRWDLVPELADPTGHLRRTYRWGEQNGFDHGRLLQSLARFLWAIKVEASLGVPPQVLLDQHYAATSPYRPAVRALRAPIIREGAEGDNGFVDAGLSLLPVPAQAGAATPPTGLLLSAYLEGTATPGPNGAAPGLTVEIAGTFESSAGFGVILQPDAVRLEASPGPALVDAKAGVAGTRAKPWILLGTRNSHRIELYGLRAEVAVRGRLDDPGVLLTLGTGPEPNPPELALVLQFADGDGFLNQIFGTDAQRLEFGGLLTWSSKTGLSISGQAALNFTIPINEKIGFAALKALTVSVASNGKQLGLTVAITGGAALGPFVASIDRVGVKLALKPAEGHERRVFGDLALGFGFKPPDGVGLAIEAPGVTGGGYLFFDQDRQEYAGVVQLELAGLALSAIGLIITRPGEFSLLIVISAEFAPVQLGFGFTLNGVGGLLGVNRTIALEEIQAGLRQGALDAILFPRDPARNAPAIVAALGRFFPPAQWQYVLGPSALIGWGSPPILTITLGVLIEFPSPVRLVLAGQLRMVLPREQQALVVLQMDVLGSLDLSRGQLAIDATLRDSHVVAFAIAGDVAIRVNWGDDPGFILAAGGFNPRFKPPAGLRRLDRLSISLATGDNPRLRLEAYLALTSNTIQFGARLDLYAAVDIFALGTFSVAAWLGFDALFQFAPFRFAIDIYAGIVLKWNNDPFLGLELALSLEGPDPWRAQGAATFHFLGTHTVRFRLGPSEEPEPELPELIDVLEKLRNQLQDPESWEAQRPPDGRTLVTLRATSPAGDLVVHPLGTLTVRQRVVPLERTITRYGTGRPKDATFFQLTCQARGGAWQKPDALLDDYFARAQFFDLSEAERLAAPSFELMPAGARFGSAGLRLPDTGVRDLDALTYDEYVVDRADRAGMPPFRVTGEHVLADADLLRLLRGGAAARNGLAAAGPRPYIGEPLGIGVRPLGFRVAAVDPMAPREAPTDRDLNYGEALDLLRGRLADQPELRGVLEVVGAHEVN